MKKTSKAARGARFREGMAVRSLRPQDEGATGVIERLTRKRNGWHYMVFLDGTCRVVTRAEDELTEIR